MYSYLLLFKQYMTTKTIEKYIVLELTADKWFCMVKLTDILAGFKKVMISPIIIAARSG